MPTYTPESQFVSVCILMRVRLPRHHSDDIEASDSVDLPMVHAVVAKAGREAVRLLLCVCVSVTDGDAMVW